MNTSPKLLPLTVSLTVLISVSTLFAQTPRVNESRAATVQTPIVETQISTYAANAKVAAAPDAAADPLIAEIGLLRKSLQGLNTRLKVIGEKLGAGEPKTTGEKVDNKQNGILLNLDILSRAEQRAEALRRQLTESVQKELGLKCRLIQIDEEIRPESIERFSNLNGSTRTPEIRDTRRRSLESEREGLRNLLNQFETSRIRLESDVREADLLVSELRQIVLPIIKQEIQKINVN